MPCITLKPKVRAQGRSTEVGKFSGQVEQPTGHPPEQQLPAAHNLKCLVHLLQRGNALVLKCCLKILSCEPCMSMCVLKWNSSRQPTRWEGLNIMDRRDHFAACMCFHQCWSLFTCNTEWMIYVKAFTDRPRKVFCALSRFFPSVRFYSFISSCILGMNALPFRISSFIIYMDLLWILETSDEKKVEDA